MLVGSRDAERARKAADRLRTAASSQAVDGVTNDEAARRGDVVVMAVPFEGLEDTLRRLREQLRPGTLVIDVTVPLRFTATGPEVVRIAEGSATEFVRAHLPAAVQVAGAFKTIPSAVLGKLETAVECDEFVCGDTPDARQRAMDLLGRIPSMRPLDIGGLSAARPVEHLTALAILLNKRFKVDGARFRVVGV